MACHSTRQCPSHPWQPHLQALREVVQRGPVNSDALDFQPVQVVGQQLGVNKEACKARNVRCVAVATRPICTSSFGLQSVHRRVQDRAVQELHHVPLQLLGLNAASFTQIGQSAADLDTKGDESTTEARSLLQLPHTHSFLKTFS
jgi:hypothetical protein